MKKHRYKVSFFITALLYIIPVLLYLYWIKKTIIVSDIPKEHTVELALSQFAPQAPPSAVKAPVQPETLADAETEPEEKPKEEPQPPKPAEPIQEEPKPEPVPVLKEVPVPKPVVKRKQKQIKQKTAVKKHTTKKHIKKRKVRQKRRVSGGGSPHYSAAQRNRFLARIRARINRAKSYPRIAQRRGMQGTVRARFTILKNGHVGNIVLSGPKVFHSSARKAIKSAFPVDVKHATLTLPATVNLSLRYKLR